MNFRRIADSLLSRLPVIGPHHDDMLAGELLLAGKKPLGWLLLPPMHLSQNEVSPQVWNKILLIRRLDEAVQQGRLLSQDIASENGSTHRHYAQPQHAKDLALIVRYNREAFTMKEPSVNLAKSFGAYLGYRRRDEWYWNSKHILVRILGPGVGDALTDINNSLIKPAYERVQLRKARKILQNKNTPQPH